MALDDDPDEREEFLDEWDAILIAATGDLLDAWLAHVRSAILSESGEPDLSSWPSESDWLSLVTQYLEPKITDLFEAVGDSTQTDIDQYLESARNRLRGVPDDVYDDIKGIVSDAHASGATVTQIRDRVASRLGLSAATERLTEQVRDIEAILDAGGLTRAERAELTAQRRALWDAIDADELRWDYRAERIARTETIGASNAAIDARAQRLRDAGETVYRQWWAHLDKRTRSAHRVAHRQTVTGESSFRVGGSDMRYPGDPNAPADLVINCRCIMLTLTGDQGARAFAQYGQDRGNSVDEETGSVLSDGGEPMTIP